MRLKTIACSLKFRLVALCVCVFLLILFSMSALLYRDIRKGAVERELDAASYGLAVAVSNIDRDYAQAMQYALWLPNSAEIMQFLNASDQSARLYRYSRVQAFNAAQRQFNSMALSPYIERCILSSQNGGYLCLGSGNGTVSDWRNAQPFLLQNSGSRLHRVIETPFAFSPQARLITYSDEITPLTASRSAGWIDMFFSPALVTRQLAAQIHDGRARAFLVVEGGVYEVEATGLTPLAAGGAEALAQLEYSRQSYGVSLASGTFYGYSGSFLAANSSMNGWQYLKTVDLYSAGTVPWSSLRTMYWAGAVIIVFAVLLSTALYRLINRPVARISRRLRLVASGDFRADPTIETPDEFGDIGRGINGMSAQIEQLLHTSLEIQREKKNYEFKVLQTQISPHFLYNTLNSIQWMASIQKAGGIVEMTTALARMLRRIAQIREETIPLGQELAFIRDYALIQSYRYGDRFTVGYHVEPGLEQAGIIKFTLQPLVENAIFHGIDPKNKPGHISLTAAAKGGCLVVTVCDDGVGIPPQRLAELGAMSESGARDGDRIGLANIHRRIQLEYGVGFGLRLESVLGEYTCVTATMPLLMEGRALDGEADDCGR